MDSGRTQFHAAGCCRLRRRQARLPGLGGQSRGGGRRPGAAAAELYRGRQQPHRRVHDRAVEQRLSLRRCPANPHRRPACVMHTQSGHCRAPIARECNVMSHASRKLLRKSVLVSMPFFPGTALLAQSITVVSFGGSYARASQEALSQAIHRRDGHRSSCWTTTTAALHRFARKSRRGPCSGMWWTLNLDDATRGCDEGLFELIDPASLAPGLDGSTPQEDYYPDMLSECAVGLIFYSTVFAYNSELIGGTHPQTLDDFFDMERFPGRRGMRRTPAVNLEFALMADGVPAEEVYSVLDTEEGLDRAFRKLEIIKDQTVWWEVGAQPPQMLADGEVLMTTAYKRTHLQRPGTGEPTVRDRLGRTGTGFGPPGCPGRHAPVLRSHAVHRIRLPPVLAGRRRPAHRLQSGATLRRSPDIHPPRNGRGNATAHAQHARAHRARRIQRLAVVERQRRRNERAVYCLVVAVGRRKAFANERSLWLGKQRAAGT